MIKKSDLKFFTPDGGQLVIMDAYAITDYPDRRCQEGTPLELLSIDSYRNDMDFTVLAKMYKVSDLDLPQPKAVFHISEINVHLPQHVRRLIDLHLRKKDY